MSSIIVQKAKRIVEGLEYGAFITSKGWESRDFEYYFKYFSSSDEEVRKYSLLVFAAGLGNWRGKSAFIFQPVEELRKDQMFDPDAYYYFPDYIDSFLTNREGIESDYPGLYIMIVHLLIELESQSRIYTRQLYYDEAFTFRNLVLLRGSFRCGERIIYRHC